ncbi:outer membrane protein [Taklimakanibacter lacteus]|uniref:outer membrane protein n=1 Tax=Taklimakanibacter lacteus TaxID=2268456 RepID=UPI000E666F1C
MLKKLLWLGSAWLLLTGSVYAADIEEPPATHDWSGAYAGAHLGYGWGSDDTETEFPSEFDHDIDGIIGGLHAGFNFQSDHLVFGLEGDFDLSDIDGEGGCDFDPFRCETDMDWLASLRARLGFASDNILLYATGGVAFSDLEFANDDGLGSSDKQSESAVGFVVGGGAEYAVSEDFSLRAEALYYDFGKTDYEYDNAQGTEFESDLDLVVIRGGLSWYFH